MSKPWTTRRVSRHLTAIVWFNCLFVLVAASLDNAHGSVLAETLVEFRQLGLSYRAMADKVKAETGREVLTGDVRAWCRALDLIIVRGGVRW